MRKDLRGPRRLPPSALCRAPHGSCLAMTLSGARTWPVLLTGSRSFSEAGILPGAHHFCPPCRVGGQGQLRGR